MAMANPPKPVKTCTILKEALLLPKENLSLMLSVFLICLLASFLKSSTFEISTHPLLADLTSKIDFISTADPASPTYRRLLVAIEKDLRELAAVRIIFLILAFALTVIVNTMTIYALAVTRVGNLLGLKDLLYNVRVMLKGPFITQLLLVLLNWAYIFLSAVLLIVLFFISKGNSILFSSLVVLLAVAAFVWYLYLMTLWSLSTTVTVLEQGCYGARAITRAMELIEGSKWQGTAITVVAIVLATPIVVAQYSLASSPAHGSIWSQLALGLIYILVDQVLHLFILAAFTVFYYECKRNRDFRHHQQLCLC